MFATRSASCPALLLLAACAAGPRPAAAPLPPPDAGRRVVAEHGAVSSANALASEAGAAMLRAGGNAVDAAVAAAFAIGVVEPQMSGLGGSGSALVWREDEAKAYYLDFYAAQNAESFRGHTAGDRAPGDLRVVGIPGNVAGLLELHERWGALPREQVLAPAIRLAEDGFPVGQVLADMIASDSAELSRFPEAWARYWPDGRPLGAGAVLRNPELAATLRRIARDGRAGFYAGPVAERVVAALNAGGHPATLADLAAYRTRWQRPLCIDYRGRTVLSAPPPQTGLQVLHTLELLEPFDLPSLGVPTRSSAAFDVLASALRVGMTASRGNGDPDWVEVPAAGTVSEAFAASRAPLVGRRRAPASIPPADARPFDREAPDAGCARHEPYGPARPVPPTSEAAARGARPPAAPLAPVPAAAEPGPAGGYAVGAAPAAGTTDTAPGGMHPSPAPAVADSAPAGGETTHISAVDGAGNAVSLTQTNSSLFGAGAWVAGFFLNDSGYRFTDASVNAPARSRWRARTSTISPTIVLDGDDVRMVVGAPGAGRIPTAIVQTIVYALDYGMDPLAAVRMPRMYPTPASPRVRLEHGFAAEVLRDARAMGYEPAPSGFGYARMYVIVRRGGAWIAVADPRHDGEPRGH
ncbi:MAG TPA: gamma-glutamyltransferase [Longimicrobiales bacterium]